MASLLSDLRLSSGRLLVRLIRKSAGRRRVQVPLRAQASRGHNGEVLRAHRQRGRRVRSDGELEQVRSAARGNRTEKFTIGPVNATAGARANSRSSENERDKGRG